MLGWGYCCLWVRVQQLALGQQAAWKREGYLPDLYSLAVMHGPLLCVPPCSCVMHGAAAYATIVRKSLLPRPGPAKHDAC